MISVSRSWQDKKRICMGATCASLDYANWESAWGGARARGFGFFAVLGYI